MPVSVGLGSAVAMSVPVQMPLYQQSSLCQRMNRAKTLWLRKVWGDDQEVYPDDAGTRQGSLRRKVQSVPLPMQSASGISHWKLGLLQIHTTTACIPNLGFSYLSATKQILRTSELLGLVYRKH